MKKPKPDPKKREAREGLSKKSYERSETQQSKTVGVVATPQHDNTKKPPLKTTQLSNSRVFKEWMRDRSLLPLKLILFTIRISVCVRISNHQVPQARQLANPVSLSLFGSQRGLVAELYSANKGRTGLQKTAVPTA